MTAVGVGTGVGVGVDADRAVRTYWRLTATLTACISAGRPILLDTQRDRYSFVAPGIERDFIEWMQATEATPAPVSVRGAVLVAAGITDTPDTLRPIPVTHVMPGSAPWVAQPIADVVPLSGKAVLGVASLVVSAWRDVRKKSLANVLDRRLSPRSEPMAVSLETLIERLSAFRATRPLIPVPRVCLHDSLALIAWLGSRAERVQLVFGVTAYPFAAHSWVQCGSWQLDDHPVDVSRYTPILALP